jgi:hypothetical protein
LPVCDTDANIPKLGTELGACCASIAVSTHEESGMLKIGDVVVTTSHPGPFTVVEIRCNDVVIVTARGLKKTVRASNVRLLEKEEPASS